MGLPLLDRYVLRYFLSSYAICLVTLALLFVIGDAFGRIEAFIEASGPAWLAFLRYYGAMLPVVYERFGAFVTLAGAMFAIARLERNNEVLPIKAGGVSVFRAVLPVLIASAAIGGLSVLDTELVIPALAERIREAEQWQSRVEIHPGVLRDKAGNTLFAELYLPATRELRWVTFRVHDAEGREAWTAYADRARWIARGERNGYWLLEDGLVRNYAGEEPGPPPIVPQREIGRGVPQDLDRPEPSEGLPLLGPIRSSIRPIDIESLGERISLLTFGELKAQYRRQPYLHRLRVQLHARITMPLSHLILCLIGLPFVLRGEGGGRTIFLGLLALIATCAAFFVVTFIFHDIGSDGFLSPFVAAWAPIIAFALVGIALFDTVST